MPPIIIELSGWLPAVIIPTATLLQLLTIFKNKSAQGVSALVWFMFGIANLGLYIYTEKYTDYQAIIGLLGTAVIDFIIVAMVVFRYGNTPKT